MPNDTLYAPPQKRPQGPSQMGNRIAPARPTHAPQLPPTRSPRKSKLNTSKLNRSISPMN